MVLIHRMVRVGNNKQHAVVSTCNFRKPGNFFSESKFIINLFKSPTWESTLPLENA